MNVTRRAGAYLRISQDKPGDRLGVTRQREDCTALCERVGWTLAAVYEDDDRSAYSGKPRPAYERLLADLRDGTVDAVVAWHPDRLHRSPRELETFIEVVEATRAEVATVTAGELDLSTASGRMTARVVGAVSRHESEHKGERLRRKHEQMAMEGRNGGGGTRPFGFAADRVTLDVAEAALVREAAGRVLAGEGIGAVVVDWDRRGVATVTGARWRTTTMRRLLLSPRIAGKRELRGEVVGDARWEPIISEADHLRLTRLLRDPARRKGGRPREYLLTGGVAACGLCGHPLSARPKTGGARCYVCANSPAVGLAGCGKIRQLADPLEALVAEAVLQRLASPALFDALAQRTEAGGSDDAADRLRAAEDALSELDADYYDLRRLPRVRYLETSGRLEAEAQAARDSLSRRTGSEALMGVPHGERALRAAWDAGTVSWRRALVGAVVERVDLAPAVKGRNFFDPDRVSIAWRA